MSSTINSLTAITSGTMAPSSDLVYCVWNDQDYAVRATDMRRLLGRTWGATLAVSGSGTSVQCGEPIPFNAITEDNGGWVDPNTPSAFVVPSGVTWVEIDSGLDNGDSFINVVEMYVNNSLVGYDVGSEIYRPGMFLRQEPQGNNPECFGPMPVAAGDLIDFRMTFKSTGNTLTLINSSFVRIRPVGWE